MTANKTNLSAVSVDKNLLNQRTLRVNSFHLLWRNVFALRKIRNWLKKLEQKRVFADRPLPSSIQPLLQGESMCQVYNYYYKHFAPWLALKEQLWGNCKSSILGFHSRDETAMLVYKSMAKCRSSLA